MILERMFHLLDWWKNIYIIDEWIVRFIDGWIKN
jgi:hypothetical protein